MLIGCFSPAQLGESSRPFLIRENADQRLGQGRDVTHFGIDSDMPQDFAIDRRIENYRRQPHRHVVEKFQIGFRQRDLR
jgi:hypothetical protein